VAMTLAQFRESMAARRAELPGVQRCSGCGVPLQETVTGNRPTHDGHACSDCYFRLLGEELERHPIFMPRTVRGA
jgi:hypothetical protein